MTLMQWLNKLGILRWGGTAGVYRNAVERPLEMQDLGVFNAQRDLMFGGEPKSPPQASSEAKPTTADKRRLGRTHLFFIVLAALVAIVAMLSVARLASGDPATMRYTAQNIDRMRQKAAEIVQAPEAAPEAVPEGWSKSAVDPAKLLHAFPALRLREGFVWRAYQFQDGGNGNGFVWAMPADAEFPEPKDCPKLENRFLEVPKPFDALDDAMEAVTGDDVPQAYLQASLLRRELKEFGASWHGVVWGAHVVVDDHPSKLATAGDGDPMRTPRTPLNQWKWSERAPQDWAPRVVTFADKVVVTFYSYSGHETERIFKHVDTYRRGKFRARVEETTIAEGKPGFMF